MLQELVPFAALHGTSALSGLPESLRASWAKAPLLQLLQAHEPVIQGRSCLSLPAERRATLILVKISSSATDCFRNKKHLGSIAGLVKPALKKPSGITVSQHTSCLRPKRGRLQQYLIASGWVGLCHPLKVLIIIPALRHVRNAGRLCHAGHPVVLSWGALCSSCLVLCVGS